MNRREEIVKVYESADPERRLQMFLAYRELRDDFQLIDTDGPDIFGEKQFLKNQSFAPISGKELCRRMQLCWGVLLGR